MLLASPWPTFQTPRFTARRFSWSSMQHRRSSPGEVRLGVSWAWPRRLPTVVVAAELHDRDGSGSLKRVGEFGNGHVNHAFPPVKMY